MTHLLLQSLFLLLVGLASVLAQESQIKSEQLATSSIPSPGPEPRQISATGQNVAVPSGSVVSNYPYNMYQNAVMNGAMPQTASSSGSWLSILRPSQGGRRASLTSRLRNIVGSIFRSVV